MQSCNDIEEYKKGYRIPINFKILEILLGAEFGESRNRTEMKVKYNAQRCTMAQLDRTVKALKSFIDENESPYLSSFVVTQNGVEVPGFNWYTAVVLIDGKVSKKDMKSHLFGYDGKAALCQMFLTELDIVTIAANAEELRKRMTRNEVLLIAGLTLAVAAVGVGTAMYIKNKKDEEEETLLGCCDISDEHLDDGPSALELADAPVVVDF